jgi:hypothetical protein
MRMPRGSSVAPGNSGKPARWLLPPFPPGSSGRRRCRHPATPSPRSSGAGEKQRRCDQLGQHRAANRSSALPRLGQRPRRAASPGTEHSGGDGSHRPVGAAWAEDVGETLPDTASTMARRPGRRIVMEREERDVDQKSRSPVPGRSPSGDPTEDSFQWDGRRDRLASGRLIAHHVASRQLTLQLGDGVAAAGSR